jgi:hypothetical protein
MAMLAVTKVADITIPGIDLGVQPPEFRLVVRFPVRRLTAPRQTGLLLFGFVFETRFSL